MSGALFNIEKLDETNYESWHIQVKSILVHQELWSVVSQGVKPEERAENAALLAAWNAKDEKAMATIILSITPMQIGHVKNCVTSKEAWNILRDIHRPKGPVRKVTLFKQLLNMRMADGDCMQRYVCSFTSVVEKLTETGVALQDELFVIMLLASLPKSYEPLVVALESRDELPSLTSLKVKLIEEGERKKVDKNEEGRVQAFMAHSGNDGRNKYSQKKGKTNNANNKNSNNNNHMKNIRCYNCKRKGHYAAQCEQKRDNDRRGEENDDNKKHSLFSTVKGDLHTNAWCIDSGSSSHLCCNRNMFDEFEHFEETIMLAGDNRMKAEGRGTVHLTVDNMDITLVNVLFVPGLQCNFISVAKAVEFENTVEFNKDVVKVKDKHGGIILRANKVRDLFLFEIDNNKLFLTRKISDEAMKWHWRYGHLNFGSMRELVNKQLVHGVNFSIPAEVQCSICMKGKCTQKPFHTSETRADEVLEIIHTDVCGPMNKSSIGGAKYLLTFTDDKSRYVFVYFLKGKDEVLSKFREFHTMIERQTGKKLKVLRSDNGTEFVNNAFDDYLKNNGILRQLTVPYTPQQNGVAERFNRTLIEMARCMLVGSNLGEHLWAEAVNTAAYLRNRAPTRALDGVTPFESFYGNKPNVAHLKIFGSLAIALDKRQKGKFRPKGKEYLMVGYSDTSKAYRLYEKRTQQLIVSRDVYFVEQNFVEPAVDQRMEMEIPLLKSTDAVNPDELEGNELYDDSMLSDEEGFLGFESAEEDETENTWQVTSGPGEPRVSQENDPGESNQEYSALILKCSDNDIKAPDTVDEALNSKYSREWWKAMQSEYSALMKNNTWDLTELPKHQKAISNKWVFAVKKNGSEIERFKARLVAKGCSQKYGVNYTETFSPVVRHDTIRMIFAIAAEYELYLHQMDVSSAYLNSELDDEVYMAQPQYFVDPKYPNHVLKLRKALYGLKQSGRQWNFKLDNILNGIGFQACASEPCVYVKRNCDTINIIAVYVDDLLIATSKKEEMKRIKKLIADKLEVVDKGPVKYFLSLEVDRVADNGKISISQKSQIRKLLQEHNMTTCRTTATPLDPKYQVKCDEDNCEKFDQTQYQSLIGSLMYIAINTRPDILHSVCKLSQRNKDPHMEHMVAAKRILRYLSTTQNKQLIYQKTGKPIECYTDADWGGDTTNRKSYTGYAFMLAGAVFSYESKKQATVALSSTEAEYMSLSSTSKEATYLRKLLSEMQLNFPKSIVINADNISAINLVKNPVYHERSKHIDVKYHYIRDVFRKGEIELQYCCSSDNVADIFTKNLPKPSHEKFVKMLGLT